MSLTAPIVLSTDTPTTPSATMIIPVLVGSVTGTGSPVATQVTGDALRDFFQGGTSDEFISTVAVATPSTLSATQFTGFASTVSGATLMGYGTTHDVALKNQAGTTAAGVVANTTTFAMIGAATVGTSLTVTGVVTAAAAIANAAAVTLTATAAANNDVLSGLRVTVAAGTPGAFTGLQANGILIPAFTVAGYTSPGTAAGVQIGVITGTGSSIAAALLLAPPTGATANYLWAHTTAATANVTGAGLMTLAGGANFTAGNVVIGGSAAGATAEKTLAFGTTQGTSPSATVDLVHLYGLDISAGHRSLAIYSEEVTNAAVAVASTHRYPVTINGTQYAILLTTVLA